MLCHVLVKLLFGLSYDKGLYTPGCTALHIRWFVFVCFVLWVHRSLFEGVLGFKVHWNVMFFRRFEVSPATYGITICLCLFFLASLTVCDGPDVFEPDIHRFEKLSWSVDVPFVFP